MGPTRLFMSGYNTGISSNGSNCRRQHALNTCRGTVAFCCQGCGDGTVIQPGCRENENSRPHFSATFQSIHGRDRHRYGQFCDQTATPDDPDASRFVFTTIENHLFDQAS
ncbi:hypothetical protein HUK81_14385 [Komagataeibacter swingsii]|uniref:Uncharacterized protein n=1 Tax=Komagataeibacter swingsii TaxID=215220 RepID=A0A850P4U9_9PROT|nr:hypothetical protein [Komagataeibacter swingsii]NVN38103.1 hypothetical protein [Komagataeibacter swingsii]